ncbi:MAG: stage II sporulation protein M [Candidatus Woesearchaeota archaeon]
MSFFEKSIVVFEELVKIEWIGSKFNAFFLGFIFTIIGLITAKLIFPSSIGLMSIYFTTILLVPTIAKILKQQEKIEVSEKKLNFKTLYQDHKTIFKTYLLLFLGIFFAYSLMTILIPSSIILKMFVPQLKVAGITGAAINHNAVFFSILKNNLIVFVACLLLSFFYGAGAIVFLTWNASVWGVVFSFFIVQSAITQNASPIIHFLKEIGPFLPHMITEALSYIGAAIIGGIVSKMIMMEKFSSPNFFKVVKDSSYILAFSILIVVIAGIIEVYFFGA